MTLTKEQKEICDRRLQEHQHEDYSVNINLASDFILTNFVVMKGIFRPETTSGLYLAKFLANNKNIYSGKEVLDLGCGSGIQGITCALNGASNISFSDISELAIKNTEINLKNYNLFNKTSFAVGDLFENIKQRFDVIIFNHPFFDNSSDEDNPLTRAWFDKGELLERFLEEAPIYLNADGIIIMPFFPFAGNTNNPSFRGKEKGYVVKEIYKANIDDGNLQKGEFLVFSLRKQNDFPN